MAGFTSNHENPLILFRIWISVKAISRNHDKIMEAVPLAIVFSFSAEKQKIASWTIYGLSIPTPSNGSSFNRMAMSLLHEKALRSLFPKTPEGENHQKQAKHVLWLPRLYLFGGFNGTKCLNDVYTFDIEKQVWTVIEVMGSIPLPRRRAIGIVIMNYLIIAGGVAESKDGKGVRTFGDVFVLDLSMAIWEIVDSGSWSSKLPWMQRVRFVQGYSYILRIGNSVYLPLSK